MFPFAVRAGEVEAVTEVGNLGLIAWVAVFNVPLLAKVSRGPTGKAEDRAVGMLFAKTPAVVALGNSNFVLGIRDLDSMTK